MLKLLTFRMDEFVHSFVRGLSANVELFWRKRRESTAMVCQVVEKQQMPQNNTFRIKETAKYVLLQHYLETSDTKNIQLFIEQQTNFLSNFTTSTAVPLMDVHLKRINKKIIQKATKCNTQFVVNTKNSSTKLEKNPNCSIAGKLNCTSGRNEMVGLNPRKNMLYNMKKHSKCMSSGDCNIDKVIFTEKPKIQDEYKNLQQSDRKDNDNRINLSGNIAEYAQKEFEMNENYIKLCIRDKDFMKRNISITLYIGVQELHKNIFQMTESSYNHIHVLCTQAILCLIEPSERGLVVFEENLLAVAQKHLLDGYTYHFNVPSNSIGYGSALLVLSRWAKVLVKHTDTALMRTICSILHCNRSGIIVLCPLDENYTDT